MKRQLGEIPLFAAILAAALQAAPAGGASPPIVIDNPSSSLFLSQMPGTDARLDEVASPSGMADWGRAGVTRFEGAFCPSAREGTTRGAMNAARTPTMPDFTNDRLVMLCLNMKRLETGRLVFMIDSW